MKNTSTLQSPQAPISPEEENQDLVALDLQQRLLEIVESQEAFDLMRAVRRQEEEKQRLEGLYGHQPRQYSTDAEEDDDGSGEFSFYKFSIQHFQGYMSHRHITQRLRQPLLKHDDEGDALVRGQGPIRDSSATGPLSLSTSHIAGVSDCVVDYPAFHGGHAGAKRVRQSYVVHLSEYASQTGQEAQQPDGTGPGTSVLI